MRNAFASVILEAADAGDKLVVCTGDAGLGVLDEFAARHPADILNLGVAEQNAVGFAAGLALAGEPVVLYNIIPFLLYRCYEQLRNDICYQDLPVALVGTGAGVAYAPAGMTHYALEDLGIAATLPNLVVFSPCDPLEARAAVEFALRHQGPVYVRLAKSGEPVLSPAGAIDIRRPRVLADGDDLAIVFHGALGAEVLRAGDSLRGQGVAARIVSMPCIQPLDMEALASACAGVPCVLVVEEHFGNCGLGSRIRNACTDNDFSWRIRSLAVADRFIHEVMTAPRMRAALGLDADGVTHAALELLGQ